MKRKYGGINNALYEVIEKNMFHMSINDWEEEKDLLDHCNSTLRMEATLVMYENYYLKVKFLTRH